MAKANGTVKFHKGSRINLGTIIFVVILIYVIICLYTGLRQKTITGYQVKTGSLSENRIYNAIALRKEIPVTSNHTGYVSFFFREGERAAYNNLVYCIDETGKLSDLLGGDPVNGNSLSEGELTSLRQEIKLFSKNFDETIYSDAPAFEGRIKTELNQIENRMIIDDLSAIKDGHSNDIIDYCKAYAPGILLYYLDGYEDYLASDLTSADFKIENYEKKIVLNDDLIETGDFVYKYVFDENWSLAILVPTNEVARIMDMNYVEVKFSKTGTTSWGAVKLISTTDDYSIIELSFTNSMVSFCKDRFVEIELLLEEDSGLKIPNSAIGEEEFYLIDKEYVTLGDNSANPGVLRLERNDDGELSVKFVEITVYKEDDDVYYVSKAPFSYGDELVMPGTAIAEGSKTQTYIMAKDKVGTLIGVYNINKGYADFKRIEILYSNEEYSIVKPNAAYGLRAFDYIALDASIVSDKDFVY